MNTRPAGVVRVLVVLLLWLAVFAVAWVQTTGPVPARDWRWGDLLSVSGWVEPVGLNTARGRTTVPTADWLSVQFVDDQRGWVVGGKVREGAGSGYPQMMFTSNGGKKWFTQTLPTNVTLRGIQFVNRNMGWAVGDTGTILHTSDGGKNWRAQDSTVTASLYALRFVNEQVGWAVGDTGVVLRTENAGRTWTKIDKGGDARHISVSAVDVGSAWVLSRAHIGGMSRLDFTGNGGRTWTNVFNGRSDRAIQFIDKNRGWLVGDDYLVTVTTIDLKNAAYRTISRERDRQIVCTECSIVQPEGSAHTYHQDLVSPSLTHIHFINPTTGWAVGFNGGIFASFNGGDTWAEQNTPDHFPADTSVSQTSGGKPIQTWVLNKTLRSVHFVDAQSGWAVGDEGVVMATTNGGGTWRQQTSPSWGMTRTNNEVKDLSTALKGEESYKLLPAPWLILANLFAVIFFVRYGTQHARHLRTKQPLRGGIHDTPIEDLQSDRLQRAPLVRSLAQLFRNVDTKPPLAVALSGPWGVGKSSVLSMLKTELQGHARCVYINPWHYPQDSQLLAALMTGVCKDAVPPMLSWANVVFRFNLLWQRVLVPHWRWLLSAAILFFLAFGDASPLRAYALEVMAHSAFAHVVPTVQQTGLNMVGVLPATLQAWASDSAKPLFIAFVLLLFWRKGLQRLYTFSPSLTRALAQSARWAAKSLSLPDWSQHAGLRHQFAQDFREIAQAFGSKRLVLLIDDLDRCEPHQVAETLATLNFVFTNQAPCFVVLAMDKHYVEHALGLAYKDMALALRDEREPRDDQVQVEGLSNPSKIDDNQARLNFARHYVRKLVQIEVTLSHDIEQGALMVLDGLYLKESQSQHSVSPVTDAICPTTWRHAVNVKWQAFTQIAAMLWSRAWCRYLVGQLCKSSIYIGNIVQQLNWQHLHIWRWSVFKQNVGSLFGLLGAVLRLLVLVISVLLGWIARGLGLTLKGLLDARLHRWQSVGNTLSVAAGSYVAAVVLTIVVAIVLPAVVPKNVPDTTAKTVASQDTKGTNTFGADKVVNVTTPVTEVQRPESKSAGRMSVLPPDSNALEPWWLFANYLALMVFLVLIVIRAQQTVQDSEGFRGAVLHWQEVLGPRFPNPREWKRLANMARFLAMRVQADQYQSRSKRLGEWWQTQLRWAQAVLDTPKGTELPRPGSIEDEETFHLSEGAAVELWMLDCLSRGHFRAAIRGVVDSDGKLDSEPWDFLFGACWERDPSSAYGLSMTQTCAAMFIEQERDIDTHEDIDNGLTYRLFLFANLIEESPNLRPVFAAWMTTPRAVAQALDQWLAWTRDLRMDLPNDDKPN